MDKLVWMMAIATPFVVSAAVGLLFPRAWQRIVSAGVGAAGFCALFVYFMQRDMQAQFAGKPGISVEDPVTAAMAVVLWTLPIGLCTGAAFHLVASAIKKKEA
ncbi:DUF3082 domain-containing protein [Lysobacter sp. SG-8]|uniref:DUF3082 domain-containing protein n=1 Tax=Marilutibacter penaei TaxID=2759900 RepID=A0A7W3U2Y7_9GAMM|nr:DUF3082 domain-containing protein [Lysobacter penaei]MBB1087665.1 DUF3082 domain-containing protein [Lysobacter penaei]